MMHHSTPIEKRARTERKAAPVRVPFWLPATRLALIAIFIYSAARILIG